MAASTQACGCANNRADDKLRGYMLGHAEGSPVTNGVYIPMTSEALASAAAQFDPLAVTA